VGIELTILPLSSGGEVLAIKKADLVTPLYLLIRPTTALAVTALIIELNLIIVNVSIQNIEILSDI
jgi:hypothetical protein